MRTLRLLPLLAAPLLLTLGLADCGGDFCVVTNPGGPASDWTVTFGVTGDERVGALQIVVRSKCDDDEFVGSGDRIDCVALVDAIFAGNSIGESTANLGLITVTGIDPPADIFACTVRSQNEPGTGDFEIEVTDASDTESKPLEPYPIVDVSSVEPR